MDTNFMCIFDFFSQGLYVHKYMNANLSMYIYMVFSTYLES